MTKVRTKPGNKAAEALRQLAEARQTKKRRTEDYELEEPERIYDEVDESTYALRKARERSQVREFIADDIGSERSDSKSVDESGELWLDTAAGGRFRGSDLARTQLGAEREPGARRAKVCPTATRVRLLGATPFPTATKAGIMGPSSGETSTQRFGASETRHRQSLVDELLAEEGDWDAGDECSLAPSGNQDLATPNLPVMQNKPKALSETPKPRARQAAADLLIESPMSTPTMNVESATRSSNLNSGESDDEAKTPCKPNSECFDLASMRGGADDVDADVLLNRVLELEAERAHEATDGLERQAPSCPSGEHISSFSFFAMDMHEVLDKVFIFGRTMATETTESETVCIQVCGLEREIYFLPRESTSFGENGELQEGQYPVLPPGLLDDVASPLREAGLTCVYDEAKSVLLENGITEYSARQEERCFLSNHVGYQRPGLVPCLRVAYPAKYPALDPFLEGQTFSQIIGARNTILERLMLEMQVPGPCWMRVSDAVRVEGVSSCRWSLSIDAPAKIEVLVRHESHLNVPRLRVLSISLRTIAEASSSSNQLAVICGTVFDKVPVNRTVGDTPHAAMQFAIVRPLSQEAFPFGFDRITRGRRILRERNELAMIERLLTEISRLDPDIIVCHQAMSHQLDILLRRMRELRIRAWWHLGRLIQRRPLEDLRKSTQASPNGISSALIRQLMAGRLLCDTEEAAREYLPREKDYSLRALCRSSLGYKSSSYRESGDEWSTQSMLSAYRDAEQLLDAIDQCIEDARLSFLLADRLAVIPLSNELASICGYLWGRALLGNRAERIEYLLMHEIHRSGKYVAADKNRGQRRTNQTPRLGQEEQHTPGSVSTLTPAGALSATQRGESTPSTLTGSSQRPHPAAKRRRPAYQGGYVLEPKRGLYQTCVLQLDFSSLYPSIIQEYNIDFTTVTLDADGSPQLPSPSLETGILPSVLRRLVQRRKQVREAARGETDPVRQQQLHTRQLALKLTANAMYGCLGFAQSRFHVQELAELITRTGRETLERTVALTQETLGRMCRERGSEVGPRLDKASSPEPKVIYGDTDSIFIDTAIPFEHELVPRVMELGNAVRREVNKQYRTLEIELDALYARMLLLNKKKYAAMKYDLATNSFNKEVKGIEVVRHDWCALVAASGNYVLDQILDPHTASSEANDQIHRYLGELVTRMRSGIVEIDQYTITKQLSKSPDAYDDAAIQPHVQVALRRRADGYNVHAGTFIPYVICREAGAAPTPAAENKSDRRCSQDSIACRAYHPDEVRQAAGTLHIDIEWYLENQLHATLSRMTEGISGLDAVTLARCMGMNTQPFEHAKMLAESGSQDRPSWSQGRRHAVSFEDVFGALSDPLMEAFVAQCPACARSFEIDIQLDGECVKPASNIGLCPHQDCAVRIPTATLVYQLTIFIRRSIRRYYTSPLVTKGSRRRVPDLWLSGDGSHAHPSEWQASHNAEDGNALEREYGERTLLAQLERLQFALGSLPAVRVEHGDSHSHSAQHVRELGSVLQSYLNACGYQFIDMSALFN
jgi:DNA polymerase alpha subunit A